MPWPEGTLSFLPPQVKEYISLLVEYVQPFRAKPKDILSIRGMFKNEDRQSTKAVKSF